MKKKFVIIGAGPTGIGAAYRLKDLKIDDFIVLDAEPEVGGLSSSFRDEKGFWWDTGGHVQFSHYPYFDRMMEAALPPEGWNHHQRESWIWMRDRFIPYPLQNNVHRLPPEDAWRCIKSMIALTKEASAVPANMKDWLLQTFGAGLYETFLQPYNFKVWAHPVEKLGFGWIGERVSVVDLERVVENLVFGKDDITWGPNRTFQFPREGGTGAIWRSLADKIGREKFLLNTKVRSIDPVRRELVTASGEKITYESLLSTIPIDRLTQIVVGTPTEAKKNATLLSHSATNVIGIGITGKKPASLMKKCWMYFPEANSPYYRVTVFSNYASANVPNPATQYSLMCEVSESSHKPVKANDLVASVEKALREDHLIASDARIESRWSLRVEYGYPVPTVERDELLSSIHPFFEGHNIYSRGRFGGWKYEVSNQDHSAMQGVEWVDRMVGKTAEVTYHWLDSLPLKKAA